MEIIKWLHVSDLHLNIDGVENRRLRKKLIEYLQNLSVQCDYVFCTGDLRYAPMGEYAQDTFEVLENICNAVGVPMGCLFVTPGNHDVDRDIRGRDDAIRSEWLNGENAVKKYNPAIGTINPEKLKLIMSGTDAYRKVIRQVFDAQSQALTDEVFQFGPHTLLRTENLNVIELDSTLAYTTNQYSDLIIGTDYLQKALERCNPKNVTIVLTHYSFDFLDRKEQEIVAALFRDYNVRLWLSGHEHNNLFRKQRDWFYEFQCGNLLLEEGARTCILVGQLNTETLDGQVKAHAWFSPDGWATYPFVCPSTDDPSTYYFTLKDKTSLIIPSKETSRKVLRDKIMPILEENQSIFRSYGPTDENRSITRSELPVIWETVLREKIIPNSLSIIEMLEGQQEFLSDSEKCILHKYKLHILGLQENHSETKGFILDAPRFPNEIFTILS